MGTAQEILQQYSTEELVEQLIRRQSEEGGGTRDDIARGAWIDAGAGGVNFLDPDPQSDLFSIEELADRLSREHRYCNASGYTVAQHSVYVAAKSEDPLNALLHDAAEAVLHDLPRPVLQFCKVYQEIESRIQEAIAERYGTEPGKTESTHLADTRVYVTERKSDLYEPADWADLPSFDPYGDLLPIEPWGREKARQGFEEELEAVYEKNLLDSIHG